MKNQTKQLITQGVLCAIYGMILGAFLSDLIQGSSGVNKHEQHRIISVAEVVQDE